MKEVYTCGSFNLVNFFAQTLILRLVPIDTKYLPKMCLWDSSCNALHFQDKLFEKTTGNYYKIQSWIIWGPLRHNTSSSRSNVIVKFRKEIKGEGRGIRRNYEQATLLSFPLNSKCSHVIFNTIKHVWACQCMLLTTPLLISVEFNHCQQVSFKMVGSFHLSFPKFTAHKH